jgi:hypothetical protein
MGMAQVPCRPLWFAFGMVVIFCLVFVIAGHDYLSDTPQLIWMDLLNKRHGKTSWVNAKSFFINPETEISEHQKESGRSRWRTAARITIPRLMLTSIL